MMAPLRLLILAASLHVAAAVWLPGATLDEDEPEDEPPRFEAERQESVSLKAAIKDSIGLVHTDDAPEKAGVVGAKVANFLQDDDDDEEEAKVEGESADAQVGVAMEEEEQEADHRGAEDVLRRRRLRDLRELIKEKQGDSGQGEDGMPVSQARKRAMEQIKKDAADRAAKKYEQMLAEQREPCPKTYVYELPEDLSYWSPKGKTINEVFGRALQTPSGLTPLTGAFQTDEESLLMIMLLRLKNSQDCQQVTDPDEADLFLVPLFPKADGIMWWNYCDKVKQTDWLTTLPHLTSKNVANHLFVLPHTDNYGKIPCLDWWSQPQPELLQNAQYLAMDSSSDTEKALPPHIVHVPPPGALHWASEFGTEYFWKVNPNRKTLVSYFGGIHGPQKLRALRAELREQCHQDKHCAMIVKETGHAKRELSRDYAAQVLHAKHDSVFCFEPPGTTLGRKSIVDSLLMGCIPVLFDRRQDSLYPWHWGSWRESSRVMIELPQRCMTNPDKASDCDVMRRLRRIPVEAVSAMQEAIAKHAHKLQYALKDFNGDALVNLLNGALKSAQGTVVKKPAKKKKQAKGRDLLKANPFAKSYTKAASTPTSESTSSSVESDGSVQKSSRGSGDAFTI